MASKRILIVEDAVMLEGKPLEWMLKRAGYKVLGIAETEKDAVRMAVRDRPSVVLMDIGLVDGRGRPDRLAGFRAAQQILAKTGAQVIFVTGIFAEPEVLAEARKTPDCAFLTKPVLAKEVLASIQLAETRSKRKRLVFVCYSREDKRFAREMMQHLNGLKGLDVRPWIDTEIAPSQRWREEVDDALGEAKAAICLVSSKFIASEFIKQVELPTLLKAEAKRGLRVYPIFVNFVSDVILKPMGLLEFQGINQPSDPIARWSPAKRDLECWGELCKCLAS